MTTAKSMKSAYESKYGKVPMQKFGKDYSKTPINSLEASVQTTTPKSRQLAAIKGFGSLSDSGKLGK